MGIFSKLTYWRSIPSYRVFREKNGKIISHIAVIDRTIAIGNEQIHVASIQSVFVLPEYRGKDICEEMLSLLLKEAFHRDFDFSLLGCIPGLKKFYQRFGFEKINDRQIVLTDEYGKKHKIGEEEAMMWRPVCRDNFPLGDIDLNGDKW